MLLIGFNGTTLKPDDAIVQAILAQQIGGVILFDYDVQTKTYNHNIKNPSQLKQLTQQLQDYTKQAAHNNKNQLSPLFIGIDYEGGAVNRLKEEYGFPNAPFAAGIGHATEEVAYQYAQRMAETLNNAGINMNFSPVLDVNINRDNPIIGRLGRSFSGDPEKVADFAAIFSKAYQDHGILCVYKHFPGHGSSTGDTHIGFVDVTKTWRQQELLPYKILLQQPYACPMVMTAHVIHRGLDSKGYPASISAAMTKKLLRDTLHFHGVVITDDLQMKAITQNYKLTDVIRLAVNAGADILVFGNQLVAASENPQKIVDMIYEDVRSGKIAERRINEAYKRIMRLKKLIV